MSKTYSKPILQFYSQFKGCFWSCSVWTAPFPLLSHSAVWIKSKDSRGADLISKYFGETFDKYPVKKGEKKSCLTFSHVNTHDDPRESYNDETKRKDKESDKHRIWWLKKDPETWDPIFHPRIIERNALEGVVKLLNGLKRRQSLTRDKMYWSVFVDCCRAAKMPQKSNCC